MEYPLSRSEKKRRVKNLEQLAVELVELSPQDINKLPCDDFLKTEILATRSMKAGARKRQIKYLTKNLRELDPEPLFNFMEEEKGSRVKQKKEFHELENLRDNIINEALDAARDARKEERELDRTWHSPSLDAAAEDFPELDVDAVRQSTWRYTRTRKSAQSREIFRLLKAAAERPGTRSSGRARPVPSCTGARSGPTPGRGRGAALRSSPRRAHVSSQGRTSRAAAQQALRLPDPERPPLLVVLAADWALFEAR